MNTRSLSLGVGSALTTFLVAGVATIELMGAGEAPGIGIIGVFAGVVSGLVIGALGRLNAARFSGIIESLLVSYATFGVAFFAIAGMRYVNVPGADDVFSFPVHIGGSVVAALVVASLAGRGSLGERPASV